LGAKQNDVYHGKSQAKIETVWILLEHGADVTALDLASSDVSPDIVRLLIKYGAVVNLAPQDTTT
jgi:hypothetical protein